jgi:hypothetical protein
MMEKMIVEYKLNLSKIIQDGHFFILIYVSVHRKVIKGLNYIKKTPVSIARLCSERYLRTGNEKKFN